MSQFKNTPDEILANIKASEKKEARGTLKVFFGMAPGVGKTYAMLEAAQIDLKKGIDVLAGVIETHGRKETQALLENLPLLPRKLFSYRGIELEEFDLEKALKCKPQLILIDELAHTNAPGTRHAKRYQDVEELLAQGINVYTTLNVQHLESRADTVASITGVLIRETVPDSVLTNADFIQLVDLAPTQLLTRLKEGKVYLPDRAKAATENFFKESNLTALRELALRMTAEWVDHELNFIRRDSGNYDIWRHGSRLMVAVGASPFSTQLVRWTRRMAYTMNAPWIALSIETGNPLSPEARARLDKNLELARTLGAEVIVMPGSDIAEALLRVAHLHNVSQIVVGKSRELPLLGFLHRTTLVDKLIRECGEIDIYVVPVEQNNTQPSWSTSRQHIPSGREWLILLATMAGITLTGLALTPALDYFAPAFFYLAAVVMLSFFVRPFLVFTSALCSALLWNFLFIPPKYTLMIERSEDILMCLSFFVIAFTIGNLTAKMRAQERNEHARMDRTSALFLFTREVASAHDAKEMLQKAQEQIARLMNTSVALILPKSNSRHIFLHSSTKNYDTSDKEMSVADWCYKNHQCAGRFTQTLPGAAGFYLPMMSGNRCLGVIGVMAHTEIALSIADRNLLENIATQLALTLERVALEALRSRTLVMEESEKLNRSLLDSVSHEFKTPLAVIEGVTEKFTQSFAHPNTTQQEENIKLCEEMVEASQRLRRLIKNLLDISRLESGGLQTKLDWCDWSDIIDCALEATRKSRYNHPIDIYLPEDFPLIRADFSLMEQAIINLLLNSCIHTPDGTRIIIQGNVDTSTKKIYIDVCDEGPGIADNIKEKLFERFRSTRTGGCGLGLSIVKGFIEAQQGSIALLPTSRGTQLRITMPWTSHKQISNNTLL